jgi:hypothetical protein
MIILPRQARYKHRETSKRDVRFLIGEQPDTVAAGCEWRRRGWRREAAAAGWERTNRSGVAAGVTAVRVLPPRGAPEPRVAGKKTRLFAPF